MNHHTSSSMLCVAALAGALVACGGNQQTQPNAPASGSGSYPSEQSSSAMGQANPQPMQGQPMQGQANQESSGGMGASGNPNMAGGSGATNTMAGAGQPSSATAAADASTLTDGQVAAVVQALNQGEIEQAQTAESKASTPDVRRFAHYMATAHRDMQARGTALFSRLQITPSDNAISNQLKMDSQAQLSTMQAMRGKDFDRDYIDGQVKNHQSALELLDRIIPNVKNADLRSALEGDRTKVQNHLNDAQRVQGMLQKGTTSQPGSTQ